MTQKEGNCISDFSKYAQFQGDVEILVVRIEISNFRGIEYVSVPLAVFCLLIGENNSGKSTVLDALGICLGTDNPSGAIVFDDYDYHLSEKNSDPMASEPIEITLTIKEQSKGEWSKGINTFFTDVLQPDEQNLNSIVFRVRSAFDIEKKEFKTDYEFIDRDDNPISVKSKENLLTSLRSQIPTFYLDSMRDAAAEFQKDSRFWKQFVHAMHFDKDTRKGIELDLEELNEKLNKHNYKFDYVKTEMEKIDNYMPIGKTHPIMVEFIPSKFFDLLSKTQIIISSQTGAHIPITNHGSGTQSLAVTMLFNAYLKSQLQNGKTAKPIFAMEEPEAHLHSSAIATFGYELMESIGQKIITTHSPELVSVVDLENIRRFARKDGKIQVFQLESDFFIKKELDNGEKEDKKMKRQLDHYVKKFKSNLFFYRCLLMVEGEVELTILPECARIMGMDLQAKGVYCVEFNPPNLEYFIKLADQFGIEWFVLSDNDKSGIEYAETAKSLLNCRNPEDHIQVLPYKNIEEFLRNNGFSDIYTGRTDRKKTAKAQEVADRISNGESEVPKLLKSVIEKSIKLAEEQNHD